MEISFSRSAFFGALFLSLLATAPAATAQQAPGGSPDKFGVNLDDVIDFGTEWAFVDVFKQARPWISQDTGFGGPWNNGNPIATTAEGWPLLSPGQAAGTLMCREINGKYPGGVYTCFYEGTGTILFGNDASILSQVPGEIKVNVIPGNGGIYLKIDSSDTNDPIRNIRVVMPGFEDTYQTQPFHPRFLERLKPYGVIRFLRWQRINDSPLANWSDRTLKTNYTQATPNGVAYEYMIELCNKLGKDAWVHVPHLADDNFINQFATKLRDELDPNLHLYIEYSNEVWNNIYDQYDYAELNGLLAGYFTTNLWQSAVSWYSERAVQMFDQFYAVFGASAPTRLTRVMGGMAAFTGPSEWALDFQNANLKSDVLAIAPYFASSFGFPDQAPTTLGWSLQQLLNEADMTITGEVTQWITSNKAVADSRGVELVAAEGGQRMAAEGPFQGNQTLTNLFTAANQSPQMEFLYDKYFQTWDNLTGGNLMVAYVSCRQAGQFGAYGILEYQNQPVATAPKYRSVLKWSGSKVGSVPYGVNCAPLEIATNGVPKVGAPLNVTVKSELPGSLAILAVGFSNSNWQGLPLPFNLSVLFAPSCSLYTAVDFTLVTGTNAQGAGSVSFPVPPNPALANLSIYGQWAVQDVSANPPLGLVLSQGLEMILQP